MASEWARKKAEELCTEEHQSWHTPECGQCANLAAALDAARAEGVVEGEQRLSDALQAVGLLSTLAGDVVMDPDNLVGMAQEIVASVEKSRATAEQRGAERERWECYAAASLAFAQFRGGSPAGIEQRVCEALAARGPMRGPEEE